MCNDSSGCLGECDEPAPGVRAAQGGGSGRVAGSSPGPSGAPPRELPSPPRPAPPRAACRAPGGYAAPASAGGAHVLSLRQPRGSGGGRASRSLASPPGLPPRCRGARASLTAALRGRGRCAPDLRGPRRQGTRLPCPARSPRRSLE